MPPKDPIRTRLLKLLKDKNTDLKNASVAVGRNAAYLHQFVYRGTPKVLPENTRIALAALLGVPESELRHAVVPPRKPRALQPAAAPGGDDEPGALTPRRKRSAAGFSAIPEIDVRASAGHGSNHDDLIETKDVWLFPDPVIRHEFRARPEDLSILTIAGDSMEPLLSSGDRILIDKSQTVPVPPGIFVVWDGGGLVAKRIEHIPNTDPPKLRLNSINSNYSDYECLEDEVRIIGRVIWAARRF